MITRKNMQQIDNMLKRRGHMAAWEAGDTAHLVPTSHYQQMGIDPDQAEHYVRHGLKEDYPFCCQPVQS